MLNSLLFFIINAVYGLLKILSRLLGVDSFATLIKSAFDSVDGLGHKKNQFIIPSHLAVDLVESENVTWVGFNSRLWDFNLSRTFIYGLFPETAFRFNYALFRIRGQEDISVRSSFSSEGEEGNVFQILEGSSEKQEFERGSYNGFRKSIGRFEK